MRTADRLTSIYIHILNYSSVYYLSTIYLSVYLLWSGGGGGVAGPEHEDGGQADLYISIQLSICLSMYLSIYLVWSGEGGGVAGS